MAQKCRFLQVYNVSSNLEGDWVRTTKCLFCDPIDAGSKTEFLPRQARDEHVLAGTTVETKGDMFFVQGNTQTLHSGDPRGLIASVNSCLSTHKYLILRAIYMQKMTSIHSPLRLGPFLTYLFCLKFLGAGTATWGWRGTSTGRSTRTGPRASSPTALATATRASSSPLRRGSCWARRCERTRLVRDAMLYSILYTLYSILY